MIAVRLADGSTVYAFGSYSLVARDKAGAPDQFWQTAAEASVEKAGGDLYAGLTALPGAKLIADGEVRPPPIKDAR